MDEIGRRLIAVRDAVCAQTGAYGAGAADARPVVAD
jgi:hypothetical protein